MPARGSSREFTSLIRIRRRRRLVVQLRRRTRDPIHPAQPAAEIDLLAARRAKRSETPRRSAVRISGRPIGCYPFSVSRVHASSANAGSARSITCRPHRRARSESAAPSARKAETTDGCARPPSSRADRGRIRASPRATTPAPPPAARTAAHAAADAPGRERSPPGPAR